MNMMGLNATVVTKLDIVFDYRHMNAMFDWSRERGVHWTRTGPFAKDGRIDIDRQHFVGYLDGIHSTRDLQRELQLRGIE